MHMHGASAARGHPDNRNRKISRCAMHLLTYTLAPDVSGVISNSTNSNIAPH